MACPISAGPAACTACRAVDMYLVCCYALCHSSLFVLCDGCHLLVVHELRLEQFAVEAARLLQYFVRSLCDEMTAIYEQIFAGITHGADTLGNNECGAGRHQALQRLLNLVFGLCVHRRRTIV